MDYDAVLEYFNKAASDGRWGSLYNRDNPDSYSFIARLKKAVQLAGPFNNKRVLDLGCGTGALMPFVLESNGYYIRIRYGRIHGHRRIGQTPFHRPEP